MEKALFSINCTTCQARLAVRNESALGAILACPKCGSMVQVTPPPQWEPPRPATTEAGPAEGAAAAVGAGSSTDQPPEVPHNLDPAGVRASPTELLWRKWLLLGAAPVAVVVVVLGVWSILSPAGPSEATPGTDVQQPAEPPPTEQPAAAQQVPKPPPERAHLWWLPDRTTLLFSLPPSQLAGQSYSKGLFDQADPFWRQSAGKVMRSLGLRLEDVGRISWASTDLAAWPERSVVAIELAPGHDAAGLAADGEAVDLELASARCRRLPGAEWPHPFAIVDQRMIVTGDAELLGRLAQRGQLNLQSAPLGRLLEASSPKSDASLLLDLAAARAANWKLPTNLLDLWTAGKQPWHVVWELPEGIGCTLQCSAGLRAEVVLVCDGETATEKVHAAAGGLVQEAGQSLRGRVESAQGSARAGQISVAYESLLKEGLAALRTARCKVDQRTVRVQVDWSGDLSTLAAVLVDSRPAIEADWLAAAEPPKPGPPEPEPDLPEPEPDLPGPEPEEPVEEPVEGEQQPGQPDQDPEGPSPREDTPEQPGDQPAPPEQPAVRVDVEARLADKVGQIELRDVPLGEAVDLLAEMSTLPISFDPEAMQQQGVTLRDPVTVRLSETTVGKILEAILSSRKLAYTAENGQVLITTGPSRRDTFRKIPYTVSDLAGTDPAAMDELAVLVRKLVAPDSWRQSGGRGTVQPDGGALAVTQTGAVHYQVLVFCEKLRNARGKPLRSRLSPDRFTLATRLDQAKKLLSRPVSANFHEPMPLAKIVAYLEELTGASILIDRPALGAAGLSAQTNGTLNVQKQPLMAALAELLRPRGLVYRAVDGGTLQVTTQEALAARLELEFYPVGELLADGHSGAALVERIRREVAASTWRESGGSGVVHFDRPCGCLIVLQSQPVQGAVGRLLAKKPAAAN